MERAIWVSAEPPDHEGGGGQVRQAHLLSALAGRLPTRLVLAGTLGDASVGDACAAVDELPFDPPRPPRNEAVRRVRTLVAALGAGDPPELQHLRPVRDRLARHLAGLVRDGDLVVVEHGHLAAVARREGRAGIWAIQFQHLLSGMFSQQVPLARGRRQRWLYAREAAKAEAGERRAVAEFDLVVTCSPTDDAALGGSTLVAPNGVDPGRFAGSPVPVSNRILFPGTLDFLPNVDGAQWFVREILPLIRAAIPEVGLDVVGRGPLPEVLALASEPGVAVHADVPSMVPWFEGAPVVVVPLRVGTGTRLKALEAFAARRPVVGTAIGLEGLDLVDGEHARIADDPASLARAVVELLTDPLAAQTVADGGRRLVEEQFAWRAIGDRYAGDLLAAAGSLRPTGAR